MPVQKHTHDYTFKGISNQALVTKIYSSFPLRDRNLNGNQVSVPKFKRSIPYPHILRDKDKVRVRGS